MQAARDEFRAFLNTVSLAAPKIPVIANVTAQTLILGSTSVTGALTIGASGAVTLPSTVTNLTILTSGASGAGAITVSNALTDNHAGGVVRSRMRGIGRL